MIARGARLAHLAGCGWFWAWALVGAGVGLGLVSLGPILLVPVAAVAAAMLARPRARASAFGLLTGGGLLCLVVAYVQRRGPGTRCWTTATASGCDQYLDPRPWLVAGLVLVAAGIAGHLHANDERR